MKKKIEAALLAVRDSRPLTHVITHQIAANDTANCLLAMGARPIMAEHPAEVAEIVAAAAALGVSLGNINESRLKAIKIAGEMASRQRKPHIIDCVGVGVSRLRLDFAREYTEAFRPAIVKGNASELLALTGCASHAVGVDAGPEDSLLSQGTELLDIPNFGALRQFAEKNGTVVVITGEKDIVLDGKNLAFVSNGDPMLGKITGSGCMLTGIIAAFLGAGVNPMAAAITGLVLFGAAGERASEKGGSNRPGTFHSLLFDSLAELSIEEPEPKLEMI